MIYTIEEIEREVSQISGTHIKRNNLRKKLKQQSNDYINEKIMECRGKIRDLRAMGVKEQHLRDWYAEITHFEIQLID